MQTYIDCIPCLYNQALTASRTAGCSEKTQLEILHAVAGILPDLPLTDPPTKNAVPVYRLVEDLSGNPDPFREEKQANNTAALSIYPDLKTRVKSAADPLLTGIEIAISGNIIDYAVASHINLKQEIGKILAMEDSAIKREESRLFAIDKFRRALEKAEKIVYIGDNAGEIVFDRVLAETLVEIYPEKDLTYAVRGRPIINDVTLEDARQVGMMSVCPVVSSGSPAPGAVPELCSPEFQTMLKEADLIISKGQGNYESLSGTGLPVFFLLRVKCPVISRDVKAEMGDICLISEQFQA